MPGLSRPRSARTGHPHRPRTIRVDGWPTLCTPDPTDPTGVVLGAVPPSPGREWVQRLVESLAAAGVSRITTPAIEAPVAPVWRGAGFEIRDRLVVLRLDLTAGDAPGRWAAPPPGAGWRLVRAPAHRPATVLSIDHASFGVRWRMDAARLADARRATPVSRLRVAVSPSGTPAGYHLTGRAARRGYLQRLAVTPAHAGRGVGRWLLADALGWLVRRRVREAVVNTEPTNTTALGLYHRAGFVPAGPGLVVMTRSLTPPGGHTGV